MNVLQFPIKNNKIFEIKVRIEVMQLEDGSCWYRTENLKTGKFGEWLKNEY